MAEVAAEGGGSELEKLREEIKRLRETIEARPWTAPYPICVPYVLYTIPCQQPSVYPQPLLPWNVFPYGVASCTGPSL